ncbi:WxL domain-containing protein [Latilactobacillus sakei]|nr:WxL domain-containing protein [Latilactobacillus sakei]AUX12333.1 WxL domain-containing protein [Latilactobacillus sakei]
MKVKHIILTSSLLLAGVTGPATTAFSATPIQSTTKGDVNFTQSATPLTIDKASDIHFGTQSISAKEETYSAKMDNDGTNDVANAVQLTDIRGTNVGWKLQVAQGKQLTSTDAAAKELSGAEITLDNINMTTDADNQAGAPTGGAKIALVPGTTATPGAAFDVAVAQQDQGMGTWKANFGDDKSGATSINLKVPGATAKVKDSVYETSLIWTLADTPA